MQVRSIILSLQIGPNIMMVKDHDLTQSLT